MAEEAPTTEQPKSNAAIMQEVFGSRYVGEPPKEPAEPEQPTEEIETTEEVSEVTEETTEEVSEPEVQAEGEADEEPISTVQELIEINGYDQEWFESLNVPVKVDGTPSSATLKDLTDAYQTQEAATKRLEEAKQVKKQAQEAVQTQTTALNEQLNVANELVQLLEQSFKLEADSPEMKELRENDPAEYSARMLDIDQRRKALEKVKVEAGEKLASANAPLTAKAKEEHAEHIRQETQKLLTAIPEWNDPEKLKTGMNALVEYAGKQGFSQEQVLNSGDHRLLVAFEKSRRYDEIQTKTDAAKKKVVKVTKVMKPGTPKTKEQLSAEELTKDRRTIREAKGQLAGLEAYANLRKKKRGQ